MRVKVLLLSVLLSVSFTQRSYSDAESCRAVFESAREEVLSNVSDKDLFLREYRGQSGYARFVEELEKTVGMNYVLELVSIAINKEEKKKLGWQGFRGKVAEYRELRKKILDERGEIREEYIGMEGYAVFSEEYYEGEMLKAYINISAVLDKKEISVLGWQQFQGKATEYRELRKKILDERGEIREEYVGMEGYAVFSEEYYEGEMLKAYINVSAVLDKKEMSGLGWQGFKGKVAEYKELRKKILDERGMVREEYVGMEGYAVFSEEYYEGDMKKAYINVSAVLGGVYVTRELGLSWKSFQGTVSQFHALKEIFTDKSIEELREMQSEIARDIFKGNERKVYDNVSVLREDLIGDRETFNQLNWQR